MYFLFVSYQPNHSFDMANSMFKGLITAGRELRQQHPSDLLSGAMTSQECSSRDVPAGQVALHILSRRVRERDECHQARKNCVAS